MTQHLGIITAYGAVAILGWLAALLYPRLIPAADTLDSDRRWWRAGVFAAAALAYLGIEYLRRSGLLLQDGNLFFEAVNEVAVLLPILAFIVFYGGRPAAFIPENSLIRSLAVGAGFAILAIAAYFSTQIQGPAFPDMTPSSLLEENVAIVLRTLSKSLAIGAFLALLANCWSAKIALAVSAFGIALLHVPMVWEDGLSFDIFSTLAVHLAVGLGLFSAIIATRNIVWFLPVYTMLALVQANLG